MHVLSISVASKVLEEGIVAMSKKHDHIKGLIAFL